MIAAHTSTWHDANQRYLLASLALVRDALEQHAARRQDTTSGGRPNPMSRDESLLEAGQAMPSPPALETLCGSFALSPFERDVLLLCAGVELDSTFVPLCAAAQDAPQRPFPTFSLALAALPEPHWSALIPASPLRDANLIEIGAGETLALSPLRIDERILHYLAGVSYLDERLRGIMEPLPARAELPPSHATLSHRLREALLRFGGAPNRPVIQLRGADSAGKLAVAASACASLGLTLYLIHASDLPSAPSDREALARLWRRESLLSAGALLVDCDDDASPEHLHCARAFIQSTPGIIILTGRDPLNVTRRQTVRLDVDRPTTEEQRALWHSALGASPESPNGHVDAIVGQFDLGAPEIDALSAEALIGATDGDADSLGSRLWEACRAQTRPGLEDLAQRIRPAAGWDDLVLPEEQLETLREISGQVRHRVKVYEAWGFAVADRRGLGISALFAGASGTGKTMVAEVLANELRLDLYRIDLSQVMSKYIGETEKNLRRVFDAAEEGGAILLFDEADALFGKRSEVNDSHDRYANIEVSYLLQRMESYRGLAILTTNMRDALDAAFLRRIRFLVQFPFPNAAQRAQIWRRIIPADAPTEGIDIERLARLNVPGGSIRNIALTAAFLAADAAEPIRMAHLLRAVRSEYAKLERPLTDAEVGGWS